MTFCVNSRDNCFWFQRETSPDGELICEALHKSRPSEATRTAGLWLAIINNQQTARAKTRAPAAQRDNSSQRIKYVVTASVLLKHLSPLFYPLISQSGICGIQARWPERFLNHLTTVVQNTMSAPYLTQAPAEQEWYLNTRRLYGTDYEWLWAKNAKSLRLFTKRQEKVNQDRRVQLNQWAAKECVTSGSHSTYRTPEPDLVRIKDGKNAVRDAKIQRNK